MTSMQGDQDGLGDALQRSFNRRVQELRERTARLNSEISDDERSVVDKARMLEERRVRHGGYHRFLDADDAHLFFDNYATTDTSWVQLNNFLKSLSTIMRDGKYEPADNEKIPAGYTYLFQLAAHDVVQSSTQLMTLGDPAKQAKNLRREGLQLETLFGGGPEICPFAFVGRHGKIQIGDEQIPQPMRIGKKLIEAAGEAPRGQDLLRARYHLSKEDPAHSFEEPDNTYIADPRNEDNFILAQLTLVFHKYFNFVLEKLNSQNSREKRVHDLTTDVVIKVYRNVIRNDLLKKIIHPCIQKYYTGKNSQIDYMTEFSVSKEFSFAAVRVGHSMVRNLYKLNDRLENKISVKRIVLSSTSRAKNALNDINDWAIDWQFFFDFTDPKDRPEGFNLARRFSMGATDNLVNPSVVAHPVLPAATDVPSYGPTGLHARDLVRGTIEGLWNVPALITHIGETKPELVKLLDTENALSNVRETMATALAARGIDEVTATRQTVPLDYDLAINDPPLLAYLLAEASLEDEGTLGLLGSILIGEVFYRWLAPTEGDDADWSTKVDEAIKLVHDGTEPETMVEVISHAVCLLDE